MSSVDDADRLAYALRWPERLAEVHELRGDGTDQALHRLEELATDDVDDVAKAALQALVSRGPVGISTAIRVWVNGDDFVNDNMRAALYAEMDRGVDVTHVLRDFARQTDDADARGAVEPMLELIDFAPEPPVAPPKDWPGLPTPAVDLGLGSTTDQLHEHLVRMAEERQAEVQEVTGTSKDERVKLTMLGSRATELTIDPRAMRQTNAELADQILEALNAALAVQGQAAGARTMAQLASIGEVLERSRRQAEEQLAQVRDSLRRTAEARAAADELYRDRGTP